MKESRGRLLKALSEKNEHAEKIMGVFLSAIARDAQFDVDRVTDLTKEKIVEHLTQSTGHRVSLQCFFWVLRLRDQRCVE